MSYIPNTKIKIVGGKFNKIKGDYKVYDHSRHETNIDSHNMYYNTLTESFNTNSDGDEMDTAADDQRREDYTGPPPSQPHPSQYSTARSDIDNHDCFNILNNRIDNAFNDYSETHYYGFAPPTNQRERVRPQASNQTPRLPQFLESVPPNIQHIGQRMRQTFSGTSKQADCPMGNSNSSSSNFGPNNNAYSRHSYGNNDPNKPPPVSTASSGPIHTTIKGNLTKYDTSVHETNISSNNVAHNRIINCFNPNWERGTNNQVISRRM